MRCWQSVEEYNIYFFFIFVGWEHNEQIELNADCLEPVRESQSLACFLHQLRVVWVQIRGEILRKSSWTASNNFTKERRTNPGSGFYPHSSHCTVFRVWLPIVSFSDHLQLNHNFCYAHLLVWIFCNLKSHLMWWKSCIKTWSRLVTQKWQLLLKAFSQCWTCRSLC